MTEKKWKLNIILFLVGQCITLFGSMLVYYAIMWHITLETQSGVMMAVITAVGTLPMFFISPFSGVWADRYNKKHIINIADAAIAVVTLVMAIIFSVGIELNAMLIICLAVRSLGQGVQMPAVNALVPELTPQEHLTRVNGINGGIQSMVMFAAPVAGAALLAVAPIHALMFIDVITAIIGITILMLFVKVPARAPKERDQSDDAGLRDVEGSIFGEDSRKAGKGGGAGQYFREMAEGIRYIRDKKILVKFLALSAVFNILAAPYATMTPLQVARDFGGSSWNFLNIISFGPEQQLAAVEVVFFIGMMLGGLLIGVWGGFKNKSHTMALSTFLLGLGCIGLGLITDFSVYLICMGLSGVVMNLFNPPMMATLQTNVEGEYMGRVFSVLTMVSSVMMPLGMVLWGPLGDRVSIDWILIGTGVGILMMGFVFIFDKTLLMAGMQKAKQT